VVTAMERDSGRRVRRLLVDGGATANALLMQLQADLLGVPIVRPAMPESTALGAAFLAGIGAGWWRRRADVASPLRAARVFRPRLARAERERRARAWNEAVALLTR